MRRYSLCFCYWVNYLLVWWQTIHKPVITMREFYFSPPDQSQEWPHSQYSYYQYSIQDISCAIFTKCRCLKIVMQFFKCCFFFIFYVVCSKGLFTSKEMYTVISTLPQPPPILPPTTSSSPVILIFDEILLAFSCNLLSFVFAYCP